MRTCAAVLAAVAFAACASDPEAPSLLPAATEVVVAQVTGDSFVRTGDRRIPREAFVLELRQRTRAMTRAQRDGFRVELAIDADAGEPAIRDAEWVLDQLQIMGIRQASYR